MKFSVVWSRDAESELADIWVKATDRESIASAANTLDRELANQPTALGESRPNGLRVAHFLPLGICFSISENDKLVRVIAVWECRRKND